MADFKRQQWLEQFLDIIDELRKSLTEYAKTAVDADEEYKQQLAFILHPQSHPVTDLPATTDDLPQLPAPEIPEAKTTVVQRLLFLGHSDSGRRPASPLLRLEAWLWAWGTKGKLENNLRRFIKWSGKLQHLVPLLLASNAYYRTSEAQGQLRTIDTGIDVFGTHIQMRQLVERPPRNVNKHEVSRNLLNAKMNRTVIEYKHFGDGSGRNDSSQLERQAQQLAQLLLASGHGDLHTLPFRGFSKDSENSRYIFAFDYPGNAAGDHHCSLYDLIKPGSEINKNKLSLQKRFAIAATITQALGSFHADGWVHKSFRSQSIKFFFDAEGGCRLDSPFLTEFELSRPESAFSLLSYDSEPEKNLYRHPERQGPPTSKFNKVHDVYALGVVLLEIGLWQTAEKLCDYSKLEPWQYQGRFLQQAERRLEHHMGAHYAGAVVKCLSGAMAEYDAANFAIEFQEQIARQVDIGMLSE